MGEIADNPLDLLIDAITNPYGRHNAGFWPKGQPVLPYHHEAARKMIAATGLRCCDGEELAPWLAQAKRSERTLDHFCRDGHGHGPDAGAWCRGMLAKGRCVRGELLPPRDEDD